MILKVIAANWPLSLGNRGSIEYEGRLGRHEPYYEPVEAGLSKLMSPRGNRRFTVFYHIAASLQRERSVSIEHWH